MEKRQEDGDHQTPQVNLDWALDGLVHALKKHDLIVIVDVLRFSSAVVTAVAHGFTIYAVGDPQKGVALAKRAGAELAGKSGHTKFSLSPSSFMNAPDMSGREVVLFSPNGAACSERIKNQDNAYIGCFLNALALGQTISAVARARARNVTIIAAGEQRSVATGERITYQPQESQRVLAIEDYLGAGAILTNVDLVKTAEAYVCEQAYRSVTPRLFELVRASFSGRYLEQNGLLDDVRHAVKVDLYAIVPAIRDGRITALEQG